MLGLGILSLVFVSSVLAEESAQYITVTGRVTDANGEIVSGAKVRAAGFMGSDPADEKTIENILYSSSTYTDENGGYSLKMRVGYEKNFKDPSKLTLGVDVKKDGYGRKFRKIGEYTPGETKTLDFVLGDKGEERSGGTEEGDVTDSSGVTIVGGNSNNKSNSATDKGTSRDNISNGVGSQNNRGKGKKPIFIGGIKVKFYPNYVAKKVGRDGIMLTNQTRPEYEYAVKGYDPDGFIVGYQWEINGIRKSGQTVRYSGKERGVSSPYLLIKISILDNDGNITTKIAKSWFRPSLWWLTPFVYRGKVVDSNGRPIKGAEIKVKLPDPSSQRDLVGFTDGKGKYNIVYFSHKNLPVLNLEISKMNTKVWLRDRMYFSVPASRLSKTDDGIEGQNIYIVPTITFHGRFFGD